MPITIPNNLPARHELEAEGLSVIPESDAVHQDVRPLRIGLLNLMPQKERTETQLARLIGATPLQVELTLVTTASYTPTNVSQKHMRDFYRSWDSVKKEHFDGFIITGAPVEQMPFEEVFYWDELTEILDWTQSHVTQSLGLCWGGQAALYHFYGVPKYQLPGKLFGVFDHKVVAEKTDLLRGFNDVFPVPVSRHTEVRREDIPVGPDMTILAESDEAGLCLIEDRARRHIYMFNHLEYDASTLKAEYERDQVAGKTVALPQNYFPDDDSRRAPTNGWHRHARVVFGNWLAQVHRDTPFDRAQEQTIEWLSVGLKIPQIVGRTGTDLLIVGEDTLDTLPEILRRLAEQEVSPQAVRVHKQSDTTLFIILRLDLPGRVTAEKVSKCLVSLTQVRRLAYRASDGSGGLLVTGWPTTVPTPYRTARPAAQASTLAARA